MSPPQSGFLQLEQYQYPIVVAWAVTIHRGQGLSLARAVMYPGKNVSAHSMAYVALSRIKSLDGVYCWSHHICIPKE